MQELEVELASFEAMRQTGFRLLTGADLREQHDCDARIIVSSVTGSICKRLNPHLSAATIDAVVASLSRPPHPTLVENNRWFHELLTDGVPVEYKDAKSGELRGGRARLIDFDNPTNNDFLVVRQLTVQGPSGKTIRRT